MEDLSRRSSGGFVKEFVLLLRVDKEDGPPLKAEDFVLHVDVDDKLLSAQDE